MAVVHKTLVDVGTGRLVITAHVDLNQGGRKNFCLLFIKSHTGCKNLPGTNRFGQEN